MHFAARERERKRDWEPEPISRKILFLLTVSGGHSGGRLELSGHVGDQLAHVQLVEGAVRPRRVAGEGKEGGRGSRGEDSGHKEGEGYKEYGEGEKDEGEDA